MRGREVLAILLLSIGCASKNKPDSAAASDVATKQAPAEASPAPADGAGGMVAPIVEDDEEMDAPMREGAAEASLDDLRKELDGYEADLRERGVKLRGYPPGSKRDQHGKRTKKTTSTPATATPERNKCESLCDLATAVCGLKDRICGLASVHSNEHEYEVACERAERDCGRASEACDDCS